MIAAPATKWSQPSSRLADEPRVLGVADHGAVAGVGVERPLDGPVLREVVEPDDLVPGPHELLDQVAGDEPGRAGDEDLHASDAPFPKKFQMSTTGLPSGIRSDR